MMESIAVAAVIKPSKEAGTMAASEHDNARRCQDCDRIRMKSMRLGVITTHPIQYYAPIFQALSHSRSVVPKVFYTWSQTAATATLDPGFGRNIAWDIPLLEGYRYQFVPNLAERPGTEHFRGLHNPDLIPALEKWGANAVLVFGWNSQSHLRALRYFKGRIPVFFRGDSTLLTPVNWWRTAARRAFLTWVYRHVDVAIAVGANNRDYFRWCGVPEDRLAFAPHAIDTNRFSDPDGFHQRHALRWRGELGIPAGDRAILFAAKMVPKKDPLLLLDAFLGCGAPGHLIMVGSGILEAQLRSRAAGHANVHFLPFQNQSVMPAVYRLGDVFVLPSCAWETWGLAVNEAMACGRAVIASDQVGCARDLVVAVGCGAGDDSAATGWVFESGHREQLASAIKTALTCDKSLLLEMGEAARLNSSNWSIDAAARAIEHAVADFMQVRA